MRLSFLAIPALAFAFLAAPAAAPAKVAFSINVGPPPWCPYGYYDFPPYNCAPYGYYGPEWFNNGIFIGAGPWYHGRRGWHGHVDNRYDPRHGYHGELPHHGDHGNFHGYGHGHSFHGNEMRGGYDNHGGHDGHGH